MFFRVNHSHFLAATLLPRPPALGFLRINRRTRGGALSLRQLRAQLRPRQLAVRRLGTLSLATHFDSRRPVLQPDRGTGFVDLLPAGAGAADKPFLDVACAHAQSRESRVDLGW